MFSTEQLQALAGMAVDAARAAGQIIAAGRRGAFQIQHKAIGDSAASQVVTEMDHQAQAAILELLNPSGTEYGLALLTEESADDGRRQESPAFWSIDPMDGTLAFVNGTPGYSVSIALVAQDGQPLIGVVYDPLEQRLFHAIRGQGARKNAQRLKLPALDPQQPLVLRETAAPASCP